MTTERQIENLQDLFECLNAADAHLLIEGGEGGIAQARDRLAQATEFVRKSKDQYFGLDKLLGECIGQPAEFELIFERVGEGVAFHAVVWFVDSHDIPRALRVKGTDPQAVIEALPSVFER